MENRVEGRDIVNQTVTCDRGMIVLTRDRMRLDTTMMNERKVVNDGLGSVLKAEQRSMIQGHLQAVKTFSTGSTIVHLSSPPQDSFLASIFFPFSSCRHADREQQSYLFP